jgi:hypothetical protein
MRLLGRENMENRLVEHRWEQFRPLMQHLKESPQ